MPRKREQSGPGEFEKSDAQVLVRCTPTEKRRWESAIGRGKLAAEVRKHLNRASDRAEQVMRTEH